MSKRKLTKEMADAFVDSIIIHGKYDYEIKLIYSASRSMATMGI